MKSRVEVNAEGEFYMLVPEDIVEKFALDDGDIVEWDDNDDELVVLSFA